ncbi:HAD-IA family hydrolase [Tabrizicola flagellatus]|uniref:HAD-IA family hydrolase n=1 Tax=Tabrizicola flagellatus TaxID=2593021 RepID=UPI0011F1FF9B|nr:HAD-IA family hydrolase [Tabrizicola flagellatus]
MSSFGAWPLADRAAPALIFDLDGTLIDSAPAIHAVSNAVLARQGFPALDLDEVRSFVGKGVPHLVRCLLQRHGQYPDGPLYATVHDDLILRYETEVEGNAVYPGVPEALQRLAAMGCPMAVATNKPLRPALAALRHVGLEHLFGTILGGDSLPTRKPDPAMVHEAVRRLDREDVLYIGDSEVDAETALNAGLPFLLFTEGYRKTPVSELRHAAAFGDFSQLPDIVLRWTSH